MNKKNIKNEKGFNAGVDIASSYVNSSAGLKFLLERKNLFKLICGAGNENLEEVERLVALYSAAGCRFFDLAASEEVLKAAQKGLDFSVPKREQKDYHFCISVGTQDDIHMQKARINPDKCKRCEQCKMVCPQSAINSYLKVIKECCIGCLKCQNVCKHGAIEIYSENKSFTLSPFRHFTLACVELHASDTDEVEVDEIWDYLNENFEGMLSLCIGRSKLSDERILSRIKRLTEKRKPYTTIIQADGTPMSGGKDDFETTRKAVEMGSLVQSVNVPVYLLLSGGTNSKTSELARLEGVYISGVGIGSYARKIVKEFISREDFFTNKKIFEKAKEVASVLVKSV